MRTLFATFVTCLLFAPQGSIAEQTGGCIDCHEDVSDISVTPHGDAQCLECHVGADERRHRRGLDPVDCAACHADIIEVQAVSVHGEQGTRRFSGAELPSCETCHGQLHTMVPASDPASPVSAANLGETCGTCHGAGQPAPVGVRTLRPIEAYTASVHALAAGDGHGGPTCSDCHTAHSPLQATDPASTIHRSNVPATCGECHRKITRQFERSIHGMAAQAGVLESPVCTDCHGEHRILAVGSPDSPVSATNIPTRVCGPCHTDLKLNEKFGLPTEQVPTYGESFHGLASRGGSQRVANCASCHGVHNILPSSDPDSYIHADNLASTCGKCHEGAGTRFTIAPVHVIAEDTPNIVAYWIRAIYIPLIWVTVIGMVLHNLLDLLKKTRTYSLWRRRAPERTVIRERMSIPFRITHAVAVVSFVVLVYSGFALKYPESWWAVMLQIGDNEFRGLMHRVAAVGLMGACVFHFAHIAVSARARKQMGAFLPKVADFREFGQRIAYNLGRRDTPPAPVRVGYVEKLEYWAALWGTAITAITGLILWFENLTLTWLPGWVPEAATVLHFLEAILATLAILVWHFYFVIYDPAVYPMDMTWLTGKPPFARAEERGEVIYEDEYQPGGTPT
ncbi:MAG: cytochrome b/b6 domain-containing protein [Gammaproteobacteria bacterium]|nr:cytochrome b/b6 domain-containing protein [Gammaproteobacteria bacterium]